MPHLLSFERDLYRTLDLLPLATRRALDLVGEKLSLAGWQALSVDDRRALAAAPVIDDASLAAFTDLLHAAAQRAGVTTTALPNGPESPWRAPGAEAEVAARLASLGLALAAGAWDRLDDEARYLLHALARKREPDRLRAAAVELGAV